MCWDTTIRKTQEEDIQSKKHNTICVGHHYTQNTIFYYCLFTGLLSLAGHVFDSEVYSWVAVFVLPVNAAINPFLYTFSNALSEQVKYLVTSQNSERVYNHLTIMTTKQWASSAINISAKIPCLFRILALPDFNF